MLNTPYTYLTYMGGTGSCGPMRISFGSIIKSYYTSLNIKFGAHRTFHVPKYTGIPVWFIWEIPDPVDRCSPFSISTGLWLIEAYLQSLKLFAFERNLDYYGRTDRQT